MELERELLEALVAEYSSDAASWLEGMPPADVAAVLEILSVEACSALLQEMSPLTGARALSGVSVAHAGQALREARTDTALRLLRAASAEARAALLASFEPERRARLARQLNYPEGTAGALMDPRVLSLRESCSAADALERVRLAPDEVIYYLYVVDDEQHLVGVLNLRELLQARPGQQLGSVCQRGVHTLSARSPWDAVLAHGGWRSVHALPVVDERGVFLGAIRYEVLKQIEHDLLAGQVVASASGAGNALGELYGLSVRGLFEWGVGLVQGVAATDVGRRR
ncbi:MAG: CBS domain-containing protein [Deltaproteobacteria bacterium]